MEFEDQELAAWLEDTVRKIMEEKADGVASRTMSCRRRSCWQSST